jgi:hypothetical protein
LGMRKVHNVSETKSLVLTYGPFLTFTAFMWLVSRMFHMGH